MLQYFATGLLLISVAINTYAYLRHERARRKLQADRDALHDALGKLIAFAAFMGSD